MQSAPPNDGRCQAARAASVAARLAVAAWLALLAFAAHRALQPLAETDLFFHLKLGDLIRAQHHIPFRNLFSFTYPDQPDPDLAWGFQVLVSLLHHLGGFAAIVAGKTVLFVGAVALAHRAARRAGAGPVAAALGCALAVCAADQRLVERPHLVTFAGVTALQVILVEVERGRPRLLWWVPLLTLAWANFHAGVFLAAVLLTAHLAGAALEKRLPLPSRKLVAIVALTCVAMFLTPAGTLLPRYLLWHTGLGATRIIEEFRRADPWDDPWFFAGIALTALTLLGRLRRRWRHVLPVLVVLPLALRSVRFVAEWALLSAPLFALGLTALGEALAPRRRTQALATAATIVALTATIALERAGRPFSIDLAEDVVPFSAIRFATERGLRARMYAELDVGCYLLWEGWPRYRVFQDARLPAYPDAFHRALDETPLEPAAFDALLARYGVDAALISDASINMRSGSFDPEIWALVYRDQDEDALVFARRTDGNRAEIARDEIPLRVRFRFAGGSWVEPLRTPPAASPVDAREWNTRLARVLDDMNNE